MIRVFKGGEKVVGGLLCGSGTRSVAGSYREALNELYIQPHTTALTSIFTTSPTFVCITTPLRSPNLLQWQSSQLPGYPSQPELLDLGRENGANISALDAPSRHRTRPHSRSWSVISSKSYTITLIATCHAL